MPILKKEGEFTWSRIIPEFKGDGSDFNSDIAELSRSTANAGVKTAGKFRVSMVPTGRVGSPWQPFIDNEQN